MYNLIRWTNVGSSYFCGVWCKTFYYWGAGTVEATGYELWVGYDFGQMKEYFRFGFKHGLMQKMDLGIRFGYTVITEPKNRFTPAKLSLKYAIIPDLLSASITNEIGTACYDINAILTKVFEPVKIDANLGYSATGDTTIGTLFYALAIIAGFDKFWLISQNEENFLK